jgi:hypothetical protein
MKSKKKVIVFNVYFGRIEHREGASDWKED